MERVLQQTQSRKKNPQHSTAIIKREVKLPIIKFMTWVLISLKSIIFNLIISACGTRHKSEQKC